jgi:hypothetical protein
MYDMEAIPLTAEAIAAIGRALGYHAPHQGDLRVAFHDWSAAGRSAG